MLDAEDAVISLLNALPSHQIEGKKRLQKMCHLLKEAKARLDIDFTLLHYGAFSRDLADACDELALQGVIAEEETRSPIYGLFQTRYSLKESSVKPKEDLDNAAKKLAVDLNAYSTVALEIASTILYFCSSGLSPQDAARETREMKPRKWVPSVVQDARRIIAPIRPEVATAI
jgi:hypothetical protein